MNERRQKLATYSRRTFRDTLGEKENPPKFALATECHRAIDLSCRACDACGAEAGCWAWIPGGGFRSAPFSPPQPPITDKTKLSLIGNLGVSAISGLWN